MMRKSGSALLLFGILLLAACAPAAPPQASPAGAAETAPGRTPDPTRTPTVPPTFTATASPAVLPPVYPHITLPDVERLHEIFLAGERAGMRGGVFSKVGDSLTANDYFLVPFGRGDYDLGEYAYLQAAIEFYSLETAREGNSFVNESLAARTSWRAGHVLDPAKARPPCAADESPLACEYRIVRPAVAVILLGTNDAMAPTGDYAETMRRIVVFSLNRGIIPILSTLPALAGRDVGPYNATIRDLAADWEIPLIDLSAALATLPNRGLGPDGIHLSWVEPAVFEPEYLRQGMTVRNLLTLQALDAVWKSCPPSGL